MLNNFSKSGLLAIAILTASTSVISKEISWSYIEGTYASVTDSSLAEDIDGDGLGVFGSFAITPNIALGAGYSATSFDTYRGVDVDTSSLTFGVNVHGLVAPGTAIHGFFDVLKVNAEATDGITTIDDDDTGNVIGIGLRHMATDAIEIDIGLSRTDVFDDTSNTFGLGARFYANEKISFGIGYATGDDVDSLLLNLRVDI